MTEAGSVRVVSGSEGFDPHFVGQVTRAASSVQKRPVSGCRGDLVIRVPTRELRGAGIAHQWLQACGPSAKTPNGHEHLT